MTEPDRLSPGVHRAAGSARQTVQALRSIGWHAVVVTPGHTTAEFYADLSRALALPSWFGTNLDALWDCLRELTEPTALVLTDWAAYAAAEPAGWRHLLELFADRGRLEPPFAVLLTPDPEPDAQN